MQDPTKFRERFLLYKEGKMPYENGLPKYLDGKRPMSHWDKKQSTSYRIPFIPEKRIKLTNAGLATGAILSTNLLDSIADNAYKADLPIKTAIGLATKESTLGNPTDDTTIYKLLSDPEKIEWFKQQGTGQHINNGKSVEEQSLVNYHKGDIDHSIFKGDNNESILKTAFDFYKENPDKYNPGLKNYQKLVNKRGDEVMNSPEVLKWYKEWEDKLIQIKRPEPYKIETNIQNTEVPIFGFFKNGKLPGFRGGNTPNMGLKANLTDADIAATIATLPHEEGLKNGLIEDAVVGYLGGKAFNLYNAYNNYRYLKNAKETYRLAREANDNTRNWNNTGPASRKWKILDADEYARKWAYSRDPLGFLYDMFVTPLSNVYRSAQRHPQIGPVLRLFE